MNNVCMAVYEAAKKQYMDNRVPILSPRDLLSYSKISTLSKSKKEAVLLVTLDGGSKVIKIRTITVGLANHSLLHPREVFIEAIKDNAVSIVLVHNHPSGSLEPSNADIQVTKQINAVGEIVGIPLLDHVVVSRAGILSFKELGYL